MKQKKWIPNVIILVLVLALYILLSVLISANIINPYYSGILTMVCINVILAVSLNLATGFLGQLVLGHAGFMSVGAYSAALFTMYSGLPTVVSFPLALLVGGIVAAAFGVIIGARLGYCLLYGDGYYLANPMEILALGNGGMSFHGGLVGIVVAGVIYSLVYNVPFLTLADLVSCGVPLGLLFGRCANFVNGELYGAPTTLPIGVDFTGSGIMYHPSQLYEALLEGLVIFLVLFALSRKSNPPRPRGFFLGTFLTLYGVFRILIEFVRLPDVQIGYFFGTWGTMGQLLSLPMVVVGICLIAWSCVRKLPQRGMPAHKA